MAAASDAVSLAVWVHASFESLVKMYAEPESSPLSSFLIAPTTAMLPSIATAMPNWSRSAASPAVSKLS